LLAHAVDDDGHASGISVHARCQAFPVLVVDLLALGAAAGVTVLETFISLHLWGLLDDCYRCSANRTNLSDLSHRLLLLLLRQLRQLLLGLLDVTHGT
jgi:hypothetical protein